MDRFRYYLVYKPFGMVCQFTKEGNYNTLADLDFNFPKDVYSVGRLDTDSEGLLLLTNDNFLKTKVLNPDSHYEKCYWVQVEGEITDEALASLESGVEISIKGKKHFTKKAKARRLTEDEFSVLPERNPPIRFRQNIPTTWIALTLTEGKNRQVRRMTAKVGFPTLRLVRWSIEGRELSNLAVGEVEEITRPDFGRK